MAHSLDDVRAMVEREVERRGARFVRGEWWMLCLAHAEKTPSAAYRPDTGTWYCQGCRQGGGALDLAARLGLDVGDGRIDPADLARLRADREALAVEIAASKARAAMALAEWWREVRLTDALSRHDEVLAALEREGIDRQAAVAFGLGWTTYGVAGHGYPALAIPWTVRGETRAVQYRLLAADVPGGRYRWHDGSTPTLFNADAVVDPHDDTMIVVEGAKKAIALWSHGVTSVCAVVNKGGWKPDFAPPFRRFGRVVFALDPDAYTESRSAALTVPGARVARLPMKPDDLLVSTRGDVDALWSFVQSARPAA